MVEEGDKSFKITPPLVILDYNESRKLMQFCSGRTPPFVPFSLYKALKLTFPWDIGPISLEMVLVLRQTGSGEAMRDAVGFLSPSISTHIEITMAFLLTSVNVRGLKSDSLTNRNFIYIITGEKFFKVVILFIFPPTCKIYKYAISQ